MRIQKPGKYPSNGKTAFENLKARMTWSSGDIQFVSDKPAKKAKRTKPKKAKKKVVAKKRGS